MSSNLSTITPSATNPSCAACHKRFRTLSGLYSHLRQRRNDKRCIALYRSYLASLTISESESEQDEQREPAYSSLMDVGASPPPPQAPKSSSRTNTSRVNPKKREIVVELDIWGTSDGDNSSNSERSTASEDDDERVSDDDDLAGMSEKDLRDMFNAERARVLPASGLFNPDDNVVRVPKRSSSTGPLWMSGPSSSDEHPYGNGPAKRVKKSSGKWDEEPTKERARVTSTRRSASARPTNSSRQSRMNTARPLCLPVDSSDDDLPVFRSRDKDQHVNDAELRWPQEVRIVYNNGIKIRQQNPVIKTIIAEAIHDCEVHMITKDAFPESGQREKFRYAVAKQAIESLCADMESNGDYQEAYRRARKDGTFVHELGEVAVDRLSHYRRKFGAAAMTHIAVYQLGVGNTCRQRVAALLKDNAFVHEGHWGFDGDEEVWIIKSRSAFLSPAIVDTIKATWFGSDRTLGNQHQHAYTSSLPEYPNEKELTIPLVALAAASVHGALYSWRTGFPQAKKAQRFRSELLAKTYKTFSRALEKFKINSLVEFHSIMTALYTAVYEAHGEGLGDDPLAVFGLGDA